ncbi:hypothetical protein [Rhizobium sp. RAF56]|uniref:hypothetical protein n=1 Tax=Rhizobium sp. RAF56 TaxID=3233062 RepID=UPI003F97B0D4
MKSPWKFLARFAWRKRATDQSAASSDAVEERGPDSGVEAHDPFLPVAISQAVDIEVEEVQTDAVQDQIQPTGEEDRSADVDGETMADTKVR